jgi:carnitine O-acetyltransferase
MARICFRTRKSIFVSTTRQEEPTSKKQASEIFWTGGLTSGHNRWFDKSVSAGFADNFLHAVVCSHDRQLTDLYIRVLSQIQLICTSNGKAGMAGEHSMMDGMPVVGFCDFITKKTYGEIATESHASGQGCESAEKNVKNVFADCVADLYSSGSNTISLVDRCEYFLSQ